MNFLTFSKHIAAILALVSLCVIGFVDYITGHEFSVSAFYLLPISLIALNFSRPAAVFFAALVAILEAMINMLGGGYYYSRVIFHYWNTVILAVIYVVIAVLISSLRDAYRREQKNAEELARANAELKSFAHTVSHDLKEPLRTMSGFLGLLEKRYSDKIDEKGKEYIKFAVDSSKRMDALIKDILEYSQIGTKDKKSKSVECLSVLSEALSNLQVAIRESGAEVTHDDLPTVIADPVLLTSVFQNLIGNAVKFRGAEAPRVHVSCERKEKEWIFSVRDNGIGIEPQFQGEIFAAFRRLHARSEYPGSGLGLATCKKMVEYSGGRIWFISEVGKGSTFYFTIPDTD